MPVVGLHRRGLAVKTINSLPLFLGQMRGYVGSIAFTGDEQCIVATSPRGGTVQIYDAAGQGLISSIELMDASGVAAYEKGIIISSGAGVLASLSTTSLKLNRSTNLRWDNHLIRL